MFEFEKFGKISRLSRDIIVTEKLDGTNAQIAIWHASEVEQAIEDSPVLVKSGDFYIAAGSRNRWLGNGQDNSGFWRWVFSNREELINLGPGRHYGEWWGQGIQAGYGLQEKRFSLFNTHRWSDDEVRPACCHVVPVLYQGPFVMDAVDDCLNHLAEHGSVAAPGFMDPEGVVIYHTAGNVLFKKTIYKDEQPKSLSQGGS